MPVKFIAIYQDPWVNNTNEFVLLLGMDSYNFPPSSLGVNGFSSVIIYDPEGNEIYKDFIAQNNVENTTATAYPYAYSPVWSRLFQTVILIPPGWSIKGHVKAVGLQGTLEELKGYF